MRGESATGLVLREMFGRRTREPQASGSDRESARPVPPRRGGHPTCPTVSAAVCLCLAVALAMPAQAQTAKTIVSNLGQSGAGTVTIEAGSRQAQEIGSPSRRNWTLTALTLDVATYGKGLRVAIHTAVDGRPAAALYALIAPGMPGTGEQTFAAPVNAILTKDATYYVVLGVSGSGETSQVSYTDVDRPDDGAAFGAYICCDRLVRGAGGAWTLHTGSNIRMRISGYEGAVAGTLEASNPDPMERASPAASSMSSRAGPSGFRTGTCAAASGGTTTAASLSRCAPAGSSPTRSATTRNGA